LPESGQPLDERFAYRVILLDYAQPFDAISGKEVVHDVTVEVEYARLRLESFDQSPRRMEQTKHEWPTREVPLMHRPTRLHCNLGFTDIQMSRPHNSMSTLSRAWEEFMRVLAAAVHARAARHHCRQIIDEPCLTWPMRAPSW
jgi:hypothetical protein